MRKLIEHIWKFYINYNWSNYFISFPPSLLHLKGKRQTVLTQEVKRQTTFSSNWSVLWTREITYFFYSSANLFEAFILLSQPALCSCIKDEMWEWKKTRLGPKSNPVHMQTISKRCMASVYPPTFHSSRPLAKRRRHCTIPCPILFKTTSHMESGGKIRSLEPTPDPQLPQSQFRHSTWGILRVNL